MKVLIVFVLVCVTSELLATPRGRMFGGEVANPIHFRHQAQIFVPYYLNSSLNLESGASLIHNNWVLTAAHCFENGIINRTVVALGLFNNNTSLYRKNATNVIIHEEYYRTRRLPFNDIALIEIPFVLFTEYILSIPLSSLVPVENLVIKASGRGLRNATTRSMELRYIFVNVINNTECGRIFHTNVPDTQFCTFGEFQNACPGDSGGAGLTNTDQGDKQVGILSYATRRCAPNATNGYTLISSHMPWIRNKTGLNSL